MQDKKSFFTIGKKLYLFIILTVLAVSFGTAVVTYRIGADQIDGYYKQVALDSARNFSTFVDGDYLNRLKKAAASQEFQELRGVAEENNDEQIIEDYLRENDLWEGYTQTRSMLIRYLRNMDTLKYLYIVAAGGMYDTQDMYLIDDDDNPIYETGYYEDREAELYGTDFTKEVEPTISNGDWGWLCSTFVPVYSSDGTVVCQVGCDIAMDEVMQQRKNQLAYMVVASFVITAAVLVIAVILINHIVIKPINKLTAEMKKFKPQQDSGYEEAGVIDLTLKSYDEIHELYNGIRTMQVNIIDYLNDLSKLRKAKERAEEDIRSRDEKIGQISQEAYRDALTGIGNKMAYAKKVEEINKLISEGLSDFGVVMVDINNLKMVNDDYGHRSGDLYIKGCCHMICEIFKHSPVFRIGGDEFAVLLTGTDFENRSALVASLKSAYEESHSNEEAEPWERYSASVGFAESASDDITIELVFKRADKAMYEEKKLYKAKFGSYR